MGGEKFVMLQELGIVNGGKDDKTATGRQSSLEET